ncbi:MAG: DUF116 domain-containing protein [Methanobacterium sp.]|uniref:DUF116 domain-containing protein n=1 Tax=Methanobacterium sp. TaxID=2164 RepID=UPI003D650F5B|nr:DUF116 domain-containing protein [Methanobacterium sp.]
MSIYEFYQIFGQIVFIAGISILVLLSVTLIIGSILIKQERLIFPKLLLFTIDVFYGLFKKFAGYVGVDEKIVDQIGVEVRNKVNEKSFKKIDDKDKLLILPHCLRSPKCEAKLDATGLHCTDCSRCVIGVLKDKAEYKGYKVFIIPGSTFLKKIARENEFRAVLGVACNQDLNLSMMNLSKFHPQGIPLLKDGCVCTKVDTKAVLDKMGYEDSDDFRIPQSNISCIKERSNRKLL